MKLYAGETRLDSRLAKSSWLPGKSLPNVYVHAVRMGGRSPQSFALPTELISYVCCTYVFYNGFLCMGRFLTQRPKVFGVRGSEGS